MTNMWGDQRELDNNVIQKFISNIRVFAQNQYKRRWSEQIEDLNSNPVLRTYNMFKKNCFMESYIPEVKTK